MLDFDVDAQIVSQMDSSRLRSVLQQAPYQAGSVAQLNEGVNLVGMAADPSAPPGLQQIHQQYTVMQNPQAQVQQQVYAAPTGGMPGVTPGYQPQMAQSFGGGTPSQADIERYRALAFQSAQGRIDADERAFQAEIAPLSDDEKERRTLERELEQTQSVNGWLNGRIESMQTAQQMQQQQTAKNMWGFITATQAGLPYNNPAIKTALMAANDQAEMQQIAQGLIGLITGGQAQQATQQLQSGVFAAGGSTGGGGIQQSLQQYEGSGDLSGLLGSRGYVGVNW